METSFTLRGRRRRAGRVRTVVVGVLLAVLAVPAVAIAGHTFDDVASGAYYHAAVDWMKANGVTVGCNPSEGNTRFCPEDFVTRGQMALFLQRLDTNGVFLRADGKADDADTLDGLDSTDLRPMFAVFESTGLGPMTVEASRGLVTWSPRGTGELILAFDRADISDCAFTGAVGERSGSDHTGSSYSISLHAVSGSPDAVLVQLKNEDDVADEVSFNVAIIC